MNVRLNSAPKLRFQGTGETFCASLIAGSRRAFLCVACVPLCLFVTERVLSETEWNAQGVTVCFSKSLFTFVWSLFITTACNFWRQIACRFEFKSEWKSFIIRQKKNIWNPAIFFKPGLTCEQRLHLRCGSCRAESSLYRQPFESVQKSGGIN